MSSVNKDGFIFSFLIYILFISFFFFCLIEFARASIMMLSKTGEKNSDLGRGSINN